MPNGVGHLCTDYDSLLDAIMQVKGNEGLFTFHRLGEEDILRECPQRHPIQHVAHSYSLSYNTRAGIHPTSCVTRYELCWHGNETITALTVDLTRCKLQEKECLSNIRYLYADEISLLVGKVSTDWSEDKSKISLRSQHESLIKDIGSMHTSTTLIDSL